MRNKVSHPAQPRDEVLERVLICLRFSHSTPPVPADVPPLFAELGGQTPYTSYLNTLHGAVSFKILHKPTPTKEQAQAATDVFLAYQKVPRTAVEDARRASGAVATRRALGPGLGLQFEKGKEKGSGNRRDGGTGGDSEDDNTPVRKRRKASRFPARHLTSRSPFGGLAPNEDDHGGFDGGSDGGFDGGFDFNENLGQQNAQEAQQQHPQAVQQQRRQQQQGAQNVSLNDLFNKFDELASPVKNRCVTKDDLEHLATKEDLKSLATKEEFVALEVNINAVRETVQSLNEEVDALAETVKGYGAKIDALAATVKGHGANIDALAETVKKVETEVKDIEEAVVNLSTTVEVLPSLQRTLANIENYTKTRRAAMNRNTPTANIGKTDNLSLVPNSLELLAVPRTGSLTSLTLIDKLSKAGCKEVVEFYGFKKGGKIAEMREVIKDYLTGADMEEEEEYEEEEEEEE
ncbi:hypothetical protein JCM10295v2_002788 [Rhodotorula toruloides]